MRRWTKRAPGRTLIGLGALLGTAAIAPAGSDAQMQIPPEAEIKIENETVSLITDRFQVKVGWRLDFGVVSSPPPPAGNGQSFYFFSDLRSDLSLRTHVRQACFTEMQFPYVLCPVPPVKRYVIKLGPLDDKLNVRAEVPKQPQKSVVDGSAGNDGVKGGQSDERIDAGKGNDSANPGEGNDDVNLGAGNDRANTRDGEVDKVNGGKGKDTAAVDKKDKVKNVEVVKRK